MFRQCVFAVSLVCVFLGSAAVAQSQTPTDRGSVVPTAGVTKTVNGSGAQVAAESDTVGPSIFEDIRDDFRRFFTTRDVYLGLGLGFGVSMGLKPLDDNVAASGFNTELPANADRTLDRIFESGEILGSTWVQMGGAGLIYGLGRLSGQSGVGGTWSGPGSCTAPDAGSDPGQQVRRAASAPERVEPHFLSLRSRVGELRHRRRAPAALRVESRRTGARDGLLRGGFPAQRESALRE